MLMIHKDCVNMIAEFGTYSWDEKAGEKGIEQPIKVADHAMDAIRYYVSTIIKDRRVAQKDR
ncbi:MAG: terminase large subunit, partial [Clostridia bacterium]|nr:terminase large subunit [Clostridia bacterium]